MSMTYQEAAESGWLSELEHRDDREGAGPMLWDADSGVCCAAYQLGACIHTEAWYDEDEIAAAMPAEPEAEPAATDLCDLEPF